MVNGYPSNEGIVRREVKASDLVKYVSDDASKEYIVQILCSSIYVDAFKAYTVVIGGFSPGKRAFIFDNWVNHLLNQSGRYS